MRHALLLSTISLDIDNVTDPVVDEVRREFDETLLCKYKVTQRVRRSLTKLRTLEFAFEEIAGTRPVTVRVWHLDNLKR